MSRGVLVLPFVAFISVSSLAQFPGAANPPEDLSVGFNAIKISDAKTLLTFLSTKCEGRGTGQPGYEKAAQYVADQFKELGLKPLGDAGTYFQRTTFTRARIDPKSVGLSVGDYKLGSKDISLADGPDDVSISGMPLFILTRGKSAVAKDIEFTGRLVIVDSGEASGPIASAARRGGAMAVLTVVDRVPEASWRARMGETAPSSRGIFGSISRRAERRLLSETNAPPLPEMIEDAAVAKTEGIKEIKLTGKRFVEQVQVGNVVGELEGADPALKDQFIGIGGHLDHLGTSNGVVYPGADDDGSGSTAVIEIARGMVANPKKPRRSLVFMTFFGEEMGLLGSRFLVDHPPVPLDHMVAELQMDMVGRDSEGLQNGDKTRVDVAAENTDTIRLVGSKRISTELDKEVQQMNRYVGFKFKYDAEDVYTRSDHYNFAAKGIPIAFLFDGFHPDYHQPTDTIDKINWLKLTNAAKLYYLTAHAVADRDEPLKKDVK